MELPTLHKWIFKGSITVWMMVYCTFQEYKRVNKARCSSQSSCSDLMLDNGFWQWDRNSHNVSVAHHFIVNF